jgi:GTP-binding protein EngB required for normal cell division
VEQRTAKGAEPVPLSSVDSGGELVNLLERAENLCAASGPGFEPFVARIAALSQRLTRERFHLAVLGQFKRGKSTLLNALIGAPLLPTGILPLTSIPTFLRAGERRVVWVIFQDGREISFPDLTQSQATDTLTRYVAETNNPRNHLAVERVEVEYPSTLLSTGVVMIDTPGIGSTLRHNTEATFRFLPECDAALFVVSADPPMTEIEKDFLKAVESKVATLCFVMNKIDHLSDAERIEASAFFRKVLNEVGIALDGNIFLVSARQGLEARMKNDPTQWRTSGLERVESYLMDFLSRDKSSALQLAIAGKGADVLAEAAMNVALQQRSLELSEEDLTRRIELFDSKVTEVEQEKIATGDRLAGDIKRARQRLEELAETLRDDARRRLCAFVIEAHQLDGDAARFEREARERLAKEIPAYFGENLSLVSGEMNRALEATLRPYYERLDGLIATLRATAAKIFEISYRPSTGDGRLEAVHKPYWVTQKWNSLISPLPEGAIDRILPDKLRKRRLEKRLNQEVESLVIQNVENLRWATLRNLDETFRGFSNSLERRLKETAEATRRAMCAAQLQQKEQQDVARPELERLQQTNAQLAALEASLRRYAVSRQQDLRGKDGSTGRD